VRSDPPVARRRRMETLRARRLPISLPRRIGNSAGAGAPIQRSSSRSHAEGGEEEEGATWPRDRGGEGRGERSGRGPRGGMGWDGAWKHPDSPRISRARSAFICFHLSDLIFFSVWFWECSGWWGRDVGRRIGERTAEIAC
jgi:hypothetical protein